jgi:hypothetical protein
MWIARPFRGQWRRGAARAWPLPCDGEIPLGRGFRATPRLTEYTPGAYAGDLAAWSARVTRTRRRARAAEVRDALGATEQRISGLLTTGWATAGGRANSRGSTSMLDMLYPFLYGCAYTSDATSSPAPAQSGPRAGDGHEGALYRNSEWKLYYWLSLSLGATRAEHLPAVKWYFDRQPKLGIQYPHHGICALVAYPAGVEAKHPKEVLPWPWRTPAPAGSFSAATGRMPRLSSPRST